MASATSVRFSPSGVSSKAQAITSAIGNPITIASTIKSHGPIGNFKKRKDLRRDLDQQPANDCVSDRDLVNIAPLQFGEEVAKVHCSLF